MSCEGDDRRLTSPESRGSFCELPLVLDPLGSLGEAEPFAHKVVKAEVHAGFGALGLVVRLDELAETS